MSNHVWEKSYPPGVKWALEVPKKTIHQIFEESCAQNADRPFTDFLDKVMTFRDYKDATDRAASGFQKLGVGPGVNVGLYLPNTPHYLIAFFGILKAGGRVVNYSPLDAARELEFKIGDSETDILVTLDVAALYPKMAAMKGKTRLKKLIVGSIADYLPWPKNWLYPIAKKKELSVWPRDDWHMSFKDLLANDGKFTSHYSLTYIEAAELMPGVPKLTAAQREAIDLLMALAKELCFEMRFAPGDIQLLNNHVIYHGRTPFEDDRDSGQDRLLLRLWLAMPNSRALPDGHDVLWRDIRAGAVRGGIGQEPVAALAPGR